MAVDVVSSEHEVTAFAVSLSVAASESLKAVRVADAARVLVTGGVEVPVTGGVVVPVTGDVVDPVTGGEVLESNDVVDWGTGGASESGS